MYQKSLVSVLNSQPPLQFPAKDVKPGHFLSLYHPFNHPKSRSSSRLSFSPLIWHASYDILRVITNDLPFKMLQLTFHHYNQTNQINRKTNWLITYPSLSSKWQKKANTFVGVFKNHCKILQRNNSSVLNLRLIRPAAPTAAWQLSRGYMEGAPRNGPQQVGLEVRSCGEHLY